MQDAQPLETPAQISRAGNRGEASLGRVLCVNTTTASYTAGWTAGAQQVELPISKRSRDCWLCCPT